MHRSAEGSAHALLDIRHLTGTAQEGRISHCCAAIVSRYSEIISLLNMSPERAVLTCR